MKSNVLLLSLALGLYACQGGGNKSAQAEEKAADTNTAQEAAPEAPATRLSFAFDTDTVLTTNESVLPTEETIYVSCINGKPTDQDGNGFIATINADGQVLERKWAEGLDAPKGMGIHAGKLYVTDVDELVAIDLADPTQQERFPVKGAVFLNDVAVADERIYFSDMKTGKLHAFQAGEVRTVKDSLNGINGLAFSEEEGQLHLLTATGLHKMSRAGELTTINEQVTNGDGLVILGDDEYLASRWKGEIWHVQGAEATKLYDSKDENIQTADIGYHAAAKTLFVPRFFANKVTAMRFEP